MRATDWPVVAGAALVGTVLALGGGFWGVERLMLGALATLVATTVAATWRGVLATEEALVLALLGWAIVATLLRPASPLAAKETIGCWLVAWLLWWAARRAAVAGARAGRTILLATAVLAATAIVGEGWVAGSMRVGGLLENPNLAAAVLVTTLPLCVDLPRWMAVPTAVLMAGAVAVTGSRAGLLALVVAAVAGLGSRRSRLVAAVGGGLAAAVVVGLRLASQPDVLAWHRPSIWRAVLQLVQRHPVTGVGPGGLLDAAGAVRILHPEQVGQHQFVISYAESTPLALLVQLGAPGFVLATLAVVAWLRRGRGRRLAGDPAGRAILVAMATMAAFHDLLTAPVALWWWALQLGLVEVRAGAEGSPAGDGWPPASRMAAALVAAWMVAWALVQPAAARWLWARQPLSERSVRTVERVEPLWDEPLLVRSERLLDTDVWTWEMAAEADTWCRRAVAVHSGSARAWADLGRVHSRTVGELGAFSATIEDARTAFERATTLDPFVPWVWIEWAQLERTVGSLERAHELTRRALESEPATVAGWLLLARLELDRGRIEAARAALARAREVRRATRHSYLTSYERDLVSAPEWQLRELEQALR